MSRPALLVLADGTVFDGIALGADGRTVGEVVFNTAMTGYQEILTDPSYAQQLVTLTVPHVGNTGTNSEDIEAEGVFATGLIVRDVPDRHSNFRSDASLGDWLRKRNVVAITDVDTRALTRHVREHGSQGGCILAGYDRDPGLDREAAVAMARDAAVAFPGLAGMDLAKVVSCREPYVWREGVWHLAAVRADALGSTQASLQGGTRADAQTDAQADAQTDAQTDARAVAQGDIEAGANHASAPPDGRSSPHVVAMDFGVKQNILRMLVERGCRVTVVPATTNAEAIRAYAPDGLFLSNGPGDPEPCDYAIETIRRLLDEDKLPTFGICLGHQLLALASGARSLKMKFGHHGANHPVLDTTTGRVMISSQNHGFAVDAETLGNNIAITHTSLFDGTLQGIRRLDVPAFGFQGHPEASPGPHDVAGLFDQFVALIQD